MHKPLLALLTLIITGTHSFAAEPPIKIGALFALSGWAAIGGKSELNATRMAVDEINASGGVLGRTIELVVEDNRSDLKATVSAVMKLKNIDAVPVIFGPNWAEFADVAAPVFESSKVIMLTASGYSPTLTRGRSHIFSVIPPHARITQSFSDYIAQQGHKKIALATSVSAYFESLSDGVRDQLLAHKSGVADSSRWNPGTTDFRSYINKLKAGGYDSVIAFLAEGGDLAAFLRQAQQLKLSATIYLSNAVLYDDLLLKHPELAEGAVLFEYKTQAPDQFLKLYSKKFDDSLSHSIPRAYDAVYLLKDAIERCKSVEVEKLKVCLHESDYHGVSGRIRFNEEGNLVSEGDPSELLRIRNGKAMTLNPHHPEIGQSS